MMEDMKEIVKELANKACKRLLARGDLSEIDQSLSGLERIATRLGYSLAEDQEAALQLGLETGPDQPFAHLSGVVEAFLCQGPPDLDMAASFWWGILAYRANPQLAERALRELRLDRPAFSEHPTKFMEEAAATVREYDQKAAEREAAEQPLDEEDVLEGVGDILRFRPAT